MSSPLSPLCVLLFAWRAAASHPSHANRGYTVEHSGVYGCCTNRTLSVLSLDVPGRLAALVHVRLGQRHPTYQGYLVGLLDAVVSEMGATLQFVDIAESGGALTGTSSPTARRLPTFSRTTIPRSSR